MDASAKCAATNQKRDVETMTARVEHEGLSFLTITLPSLGKDFERSLAEGQIAPTAFRSFRKVGRIPAFMQGIFAQVFDVTSGRLRDEPEIPAIEGIRQVAYAFKKLAVPCNSVRVRKALSEFVRCESDLREPLDPADLATFVAVSDCLWNDVFRRRVLNPPDVQTLIPRHGPGATQERISGNQKYKHLRWHERLENFFPLLHFAFPSESVVVEESYGYPTGYAEVPRELQDVTLVPEAQEQPVRVITVPKTLKSPRIIAIEPVCMQYTQQALSREIVKTLQESPLTSGHVNFDNQQVNRDLAMNASASGEFATLDLSEASDRVLYSVAIRMFDRIPDYQGAIAACRTKRAQLPDGQVLALEKFASMGSALCFPVESMYFYTICVVARLARNNLPVTLENIYNVSRGIYVYGDDLVVPVDEAATIMDYLQKYHCKVNAAKSFWTGKFRESCGMDAYDGEEVTPTYVRQLCPMNRRDARQLVSWIEAANHFYKKGFWLTSAHMLSVCESILGALPIMGEQAAGLGKVSFQHLVSAERWNVRYHVHEVRAWCAVPVYQKDELEGYPALMKCLLRLESGMEPASVQEDHLHRSARHGAVALKRRWIRPY